MTNYDIAEKWVNNNFSGIYSKYYKNVSYNNNKFFSYNTTIALKTTDKYGNDIILISANSMTPTTSKHLSALNYALKGYNTILVPFVYGDSFYYDTDGYIIQKLISRCTRRLDNYIKDFKNFVLAENRQDFRRYFTMLINLQQITNVDIKIIEKYRKIQYKLDDDNFIKKLKSNVRKQKNKEQKTIKTTINNLMSHCFYNELLNEIFNYSHFTDDVKRKLLEAVNKKYHSGISQTHYLYYNPEMNCVQTNTSYKVDVNTAYPVLKLILSRKIPLNYTFQNYSIKYNNNDNTVNVGCHKFSMINIELVLNTLNEQVRICA